MLTSAYSISATQSTHLLFRRILFIIILLLLIVEKFLHITPLNILITCNLHFPSNSITFEFRSFSIMTSQCE